MRIASESSSLWIRFKRSSLSFQSFLQAEVWKWRWRTAATTLSLGVAGVGFSGYRRWIQRKVEIPWLLLWTYSCVSGFLVERESCMSHLEKLWTAKVWQIFESAVETTTTSWCIRIYFPCTFKFPLDKMRSANLSLHPWFNMNAVLNLQIWGFTTQISKRDAELALAKLGLNHRFPGRRNNNPLAWLVKAYPKFCNMIF